MNSLNRAQYICIQQKGTRASISESKPRKNDTKIIHRPDWGRVVSEAEKIIEQPSLNWEFINEVTNLAIKLREFTDVDHPLLKRAK